MPYDDWSVTMPRKSRDERLDTRTPRLKLAPRREPYWRNIQEGRAIGYRRLPGGKAGTWIARHYDPTETPPRRTHPLGSADDYDDADGAHTLNFAQAQDHARRWFFELGRGGGRVAKPITVKKAMTDYIADYTARGGKAVRDTNAVISAHILPKLGERLVPNLTAAVIKDWHRGLATSPARIRTSTKTPKAKTPTPKVPKADLSGDALRARRATANRVLTVLKAALNHAFAEGTVASDDAWRRVKPFPKVDAAVIRYLSDDEAIRLVNACPVDLRRLVTAALFTGCRYGELISLRPRDLDLSAGVLIVRAAKSKSGVARSVVLTDEARRFFTSVAAGLTANAVLLPRDDGDPWGKSHQFRPLREACSAARITPAVSFHILRHTHASRLAVRGVPMAVIASQLGHGDLKITARHYAHLSPGYVAETVRAAFGELGFAPMTNVTPMATGAA
jgi:integrase